MSRIKKPHPEGIEQIVSLNGYCNVLSCGDTLDDYRAAKDAKVSFVGILPPNEKSQRNYENSIYGAGLSGCFREY